MDKPSISKKEEKESNQSVLCDIESDLRDKRSNNKTKIGANEMLGSDNPPPECSKQDSKVTGLDNCEVCTMPKKLLKLKT